MANNKMKRAEIREGRIWLEGKLLENPRFLDLRVIESPPKTPYPLTEEEAEDFLEIAAEMGDRPEDANAYILGKNNKSYVEHTGPWKKHIVWTGSILYLNSGLR